MIALISVYDKAGVRELALNLAELGFDIYSTGGTQRHLGEAGPRPEVTLDEALENIDIGGPAMLRAAAKNFPSVLVLVDPADYDETLDSLRTGDIPLEFRRRLAEKAFQHVASYDTAVAQYLRGDDQPFPDRMTVALTKALDLRYGENPHQRAALYREDAAGSAGIVAAEKLHGLELSYINVMDADAAWEAGQEVAEPAVVIVKHANPCGIATAGEIADAYQRAFDSDPMSPFGGIIAANRPVTEAMVAAMKGMRYDVIVAPEYEPAALERLRHRRDLRILRLEAGGGRCGWPESGRGAGRSPRTPSSRSPATTGWRSPAAPA